MALKYFGQRQTLLGEKFQSQQIQQCLGRTKNFLGRGLCHFARKYSTTVQPEKAVLEGIGPKQNIINAFGLVLNVSNNLIVSSGVAVT